MGGSLRLRYVLNACLLVGGLGWMCFPERFVVQTSLLGEDEIFVNPRAGDFRPKPGSPVIGLGRPIVEVATDFAGNPRDLNRPSIGAYEIGDESAPVGNPPLSHGGMADMTFTQVVLWLTLLTNLVSLAVAFTLWRAIAQERLKKLDLAKRRPKKQVAESILDIIVKEQENK